LSGAPELLRVAVEAWRRVWVDFEVPQVGKRIIPWLQAKYGITEREAKAIDQIIRKKEYKAGARSLRGRSADLALKWVIIDE
jgi:hypothetical protein